MMEPLSPFLCLLFSLLVYVRAAMNNSVQQPFATTSIANVSSQLSFSISSQNISSSTVSNFSYIIPFGHTQSCNIYGPICQTGSITVGVNLTSATTTTVLPCSSYLSAQSAYLDYENNPDDPEAGFWSNEFDGVGEDTDLSDWALNFGQSPECRSYAEAMSKGQYTFSECGSSNTIIQTAGGLDFSYPSQIPPAVARYFYPDVQGQGTCCGNCSLDIPEVRLYYFPDKTAVCNQNRTTNITSTLTARTIEKRIHSLVADGSIAVVSGHTFTSPSIYLQIVGTVAVRDQCTTVGPTLTDPIVTLPSNGVSTWKPIPNQWVDDDNFTAGEVWEDPTAIIGFDFADGIAPLNLKDLACPTWGLGRSTAVNGTVITTIGPPWLPLIIPPLEIFTLDPTWALRCTGVFSDQLGALTTIALFDPPIALTPASLLAPTPPARPTPAPTPTPTPMRADPTTIPERATPSTTAARPVSLLNGSVAPPARTGGPGKDSLTQSPVVAPADPAESADKGDPPSDPEVPPADGDPSSPSAPDPPSDGSQQSPTDPKDPIVSAPLQGESPLAQTHGLGAIIYNAFAKSGTEIDEFSSVLLPPQPIFTVGTQTFTANSKGFKVNNAAIVPGGTAQTIDGTKISLDPAGVLAIGSSTIPLTDPATPVLAVAGQTFIPNPSAFSIAGTVVSAGGPAATVSGTVVSLGQLGELAIGSTTISLATPSSDTAFTVAGQTFTPNPSAFSIAGTMISADGPAVTISGTIISLGQSGALAIGSSTISLLSPVDPPPGKVYTLAGQTFTPNPSAFSIAGTAVSAGGPAVTVSGTIIRLDPHGALAIGSSTISLPNPIQTSPFSNKAYTIANQIFTPNPSAFLIGHATISAGDPALTIDGTRIALLPSGNLILGTSTIPLVTTQPTPSADITVDGLDVNVESSFVVVGGITLSAGAAGVTVSGEDVVSLEAGGGVLDVNGTGRFALPTGSVADNASGDDNVQIFTGGGVGRAKGLRMGLVSLLLGFYGMMIAMLMI